MTVAAPRAAEDRSHVDEPEELDAVVVDSPRRRLGVRPLVMVGAVVAMVLALVAFAFDGPIADAWYRTRQHHLAADLRFGTHKHLTKGEAVAVVQVPRLGVNVVAAEGDSPTQLRGGPGHRPGTPLPGRLGNSVVLGHRDAWGAPFASLGKVRRNDFIVVQDRAQKTFAYEVISVKRARASDPGPFSPSEDYRLTLVTGTGGRRSSERLVVTAVSGDRAKLPARPPDLGTGVPVGSRLLNWSVGLAAVAAGLGVIALFALRRRYGRAALAIVLAPLVAATLLGVYLALDLLLPPLR